MQSALAQPGVAAGLMIFCWLVLPVALALLARATSWRSMLWSVPLLAASSILGIVVWFVVARRHSRLATAALIMQIACLLLFAFVGMQEGPRMAVPR